MEREYKETHQSMISDDDDHIPDVPEKADLKCFKSRPGFNGFMFFLFAFLMAILWISLSYVSLLLFKNPLFTLSRFLRSMSSSMFDCDTPRAGFQCKNPISHKWGQYSPFFNVPGAVSPEIPNGCEVTFAQLLSRHGARDPTLFKTLIYNETISKIQSTVDHFNGKYAFLANYTYTLGADQLTYLGEQEMVHSGIDFFNRYESLTKKYSPFVRAASQERVVESARNFIRGYLDQKISSTRSDSDSDPYPILVIREGIGFNNTLGHSLCEAFEQNPIYRDLGSSAQEIYASTFLPPITARLNANLQPFFLSLKETIFIMDLCPFNTVASPTGALSPFCALFSQAEWGQYNHYQSLGKYYGYGAGNPFGPTLGVGYVNELVARLTASPVDDHTSTNRTLDSDSATFPFGPGYRLFADFSHDNTLASIYAALGLDSSFPPLSNTTLNGSRQTDGYSAATFVPFGARMYIEKLQCRGANEEGVRIIVNGRVVPVEACKSHSIRDGQCPLSVFLKTVAWAKDGGRWADCFQ